MNLRRKLVIDRRANYTDLSVFTVCRDVVYIVKMVRVLDKADAMLTLSTAL